MRSVGLYTLGCKVSQYETEAIAERFVSRGFSVLPFTDVCDAYVVNTCTVTAESDRKSRQVIRRAIAKNPDAVVAVIGCYTQRAPIEVAGIEGVDVVLGKQDKLSVVDRVIERLDGECGQHVSAPSLDGAEFEPMCITRAPRTRAYVKIEDGCEAKCTYCAISGARGRVRSKPREEVISEVAGLASTGVREVVLTGIETGSFGVDLYDDYRLADLIVDIDKLGIVDRIRLGSLAPELVGSGFAERVSRAHSLAPHFHLSVQSGSSRILAAMKRRYNRNMALANIDLLRRYIPGAQFTTDLMVGFPGESEQDFLDTVDFVRRARFIDAHVFAYSRRAGTPAANYPDQIPERVKRERSRELIRVKNEVRDEVLDDLVARAQPLGCILETYSCGSYAAHSDEFAEVSVTAEEGREGEYVKVAPVSHKNGIIYGKIIK